jgi:hypothetical protein
VLITSGNLVITVLKYSRKDANNHPLRGTRQAITTAVSGRRLRPVPVGYLEACT